MDKLITPGEISLLQENSKQSFALLFVATSIDLKSIRNGFVKDELIYKGNLTLGKEITLLVAKEEHVAKVRKYLRKHQLSGKVYTMSDAQFCRFNFSWTNFNNNNDWAEEIQSEITANIKQKHMASPDARSLEEPNPKRMKLDK